MNNGATIFDDRETVELLRDHPHLLAIADAVRATQSGRPSLAHRRKPLLVAAAALVACGTAAAVTISFALPSASSPHSPASGTLPPMPPAIPVPLAQAQSDALTWFGVPLILPDTSVLGHSGSPTILEQPCHKPLEAPTAPLCWVTVQFASPAVDIEYVQTSHTFGSSYPDARDQYQREIANATNPSDFQIVSLGGTPALSESAQTGSTIEFRLGTLSISISAPNINGSPTTVDAATLKGLAQTMLDQHATNSS